MIARDGNQPKLAFLKRERPKGLLRGWSVSAVLSWCSASGSILHLAPGLDLSGLKTVAEAEHPFPHNIYEVAGLTHLCSDWPSPGHMLPSNPSHSAVECRPLPVQAPGSALTSRGWLEPHPGHTGKNRGGRHPKGKLRRGFQKGVAAGRQK